MNSETNLKISIITVCRNSDATIEKTINSVISQSYKNIEYIIIDGVSTDGTLEIIKKYALADERIKYISEKDSGIYDAMNKGLAMASGTVIGIINSDDIYLPDAIQKSLDNIVKNSAKSGTGLAVSYGLLRKIYADGSFVISGGSPDRLRYGMINHPTYFVTKAVYEKFGYFDTSYRIAADYDFALRLFSSGNVMFIPIDDILVNFSACGISSVDYRVRLEELNIKKKYKLISGSGYIFNRMVIGLLQMKKRMKIKK